MRLLEHRRGECPGGGRRGCQSLHPTAQCSLHTCSHTDTEGCLSLSSTRRGIREHFFKQSCLCFLKAAPCLHPSGNTMSQQHRSKPIPFPHPKQKLWSQQFFQRSQWSVTISQPSQSTICSMVILKRDKRVGHYRCVLRKR